MTLTEAAGVICSLISSGIAAYLALRRDKRRDKKENDEEGREGEKTTITYWRNFAREQRKAYEDDLDKRKRAHDQDIERLENKIAKNESVLNEVQEREKNCQISLAVNRAELERLKDGFNRTKAALSNHGIKVDPGTDSHTPLGEE